MRTRREFITLLCGSAALPFAAFASDRVRLIGMLLSQPEGDQEAKDRIAALREGLQKLGWTEGRNIRVETRYASGSADRMQAHAVDLAQMRPDMLFAAATSSLAALNRATSTIPIVFAREADRVCVIAMARDVHVNVICYSRRRSRTPSPDVETCCETCRDSLPLAAG